MPTNKAPGDLQPPLRKWGAGNVCLLVLNTLLLNEGIPRALKGKKLRLKNILLFPSEYNGNYLQKVMPLENVNK